MQFGMTYHIFKNGQVLTGFSLKGTFKTLNQSIIYIDGHAKSWHQMTIAITPMTYAMVLSDIQVLLMYHLTQITLISTQRHRFISPEKYSMYGKQAERQAPL